MYAVSKTEFMPPFIFRPFVVIATGVDTVKPPVSYKRHENGKEDSLEVNRSSLRAY
jgi:hypothetical protein